jgi:hypothetical protein
MKQNYSRYVVSAFVILMAVVACGLPAPVTQPIPPTAPGSMETAVAGTFQAAQQLTEQAAPPTETVAPATVEPAVTGMSKETQSDGTTVFTDHDGGYRLTFPEGWTVVIPGEGDISEALNSVPEQEESISKLIEAAKSADANNAIRVFSFALGAQQGAYTPNISISRDTNPLLAAATMKDLIDATVAYYPSMGIEVTHSEVKQTSSDMEIGVIETAWTMNAPSGDKIDLRQKQIMFKSGEGFVILTFSTVKNATIDLTADVDKVIESFQFMD